MYKLLIIIQFGSSHSSQLASYDTIEQADEAFKIVKNAKLSYNLTVTKLY
jgi:hypothetical protein